MMIEVKLRKVISVMAGKRSLGFRLYRGVLKCPGAISGKPGRVHPESRQGRFLTDHLGQIIEISGDK
jgi:hypothetical protein